MHKMYKLTGHAPLISHPFMLQGRSHLFSPFLIGQINIAKQKYIFKFSLYLNVLCIKQSQLLLQFISFCMPLVCSSTSWASYLVISSVEKCVCVLCCDYTVWLLLNQFTQTVISLNYICLLYLAALSHHGTANHTTCIQGLSSLGVITLYHDNRLYWLHN